MNNMEKDFKGKKIIVRPLAQKDIALAKELRDYFNELIAEDAKILMKNKKTLADAREWVNDRLKKMRRRKVVCLLAQNNKQIVGLAILTLGKERQNHIAVLSINVRDGFRRIGLGNYLIQQVIKLAKAKLKPRPKIIQLKVFANNWPAVNLYQKLGFRKAALVPKQIQYKGKLINEYVMLLEV